MSRRTEALIASSLAGALVAGLMMAMALESKRLANPALQQPNASRVAQRSADAATPRAEPAAPRGRDTVEGDLGVRR